MIRLSRSAPAVLCFAWGTGCGSDGSDSEVPACDGADLFLDEACLTGVMERCRAIEDQDGCRAAARIQTGGFEVMCGWTRVTPLLEATTCELGPSFGRCEAGLEYFDGATAPGICDEEGKIPLGIEVFVAEREFVQIVAEPGAPMLSGLLGPWARVGATPGTVLAVCGEGWSPPGPSWCSCAEAVCVGP